MPVQNACTKLERIICLLKDFVIDELDPITLFEHNDPFITISKGESAKARSRSIAVKCQLMKKMYKKRQIEVEYCPTNEMMACILTNPLGKGKFECLRKKLNLNVFRVET